LRRDGCALGVILAVPTVAVVVVAWSQQKSMVVAIIEKSQEENPSLIVDVSLGA
jgi:predicted PurR-regulated permease PerM